MSIPSACRWAGVTTSAAPRRVELVRGLRWGGCSCRRRSCVPVARARVGRRAGSENDDDTFAAHAAAASARAGRSVTAATCAGLAARPLRHGWAGSSRDIGAGTDNRQREWADAVR